MGNTIHNAKTIITIPTRFISPAKVLKITEICQLLQKNFVFTQIFTIFAARNEAKQTISSDF